jgi:plastocyanin
MQRHSRASVAAFLIFGALVGGRVSPAAAVTHDVQVRNFQFVPASLTISPGDAVRWIWVEGMHTTTSGTAGTPNGIWNAPIDVSNTTFTRTFGSAGTFPYYCGFHFGIGMTGTITVGASNSAPVVTNPGPRTGLEEVFFSVTVNASDSDGDPLTMTDLGTTPAWAVFTDNGNNTATISGTPALGDAGTYNQSVRAGDGSLSDTESFDITIDAAQRVVVQLPSGGWTPRTVTIDPGWEVRWEKVAGGNHSTTSGTGGVPDGIWDAPLTAQSQTFTRLFATPGIYPYFCSSHPADVGTVAVNDTAAVVGIVQTRQEPPRRLLPPYPNPFSAKVTLAFDLVHDYRVQIHVFGIDGRAVRTLLVGEFPQGHHEVVWEGRNDTGGMMPAGIYFVQLVTGSERTVRKIFKTH